ncbi:MAG: hypothetical protein RLZZ292_1462 [Bacteroidota bacterium]|jgi:Uma2 family endonuclease
MVATTTITKPPRRSSKIPSYLVREVLNGKSLHYKGYKEVLKGTKSIDKIMGSSSLQAILVNYLLEIIHQNYDRKKYRILANEAGIHLKHGDNLAGDILIYEKATLTAEKINTRYSDVTPYIAVEVDVNIDPSDMHEMDYVLEKTQKLIHFGVTKVLWILSKTQKVIVATPNNPWLIYQWNTDIEIMEGQIFNIATYLEEEGIEVL